MVKALSLANKTRLATELPFYKGTKPVIANASLIAVAALLWFVDASLINLVLPHSKSTPGCKFRGSWV